MASYKYMCGKKLRQLPDGSLLPMLPGRPQDSGRYGEETVAVRVPRSFLPYIQQVLKKLEQIESLRRNMERSFFNVSSDFNGGSRGE